MRRSSCGQARDRATDLDAAERGAGATRVEPGEFIGIPVDAGTVCFVNGGALATGMPDGDWMTLFEDSGDDFWFRSDGRPGAHP